MSRTPDASATSLTIAQIHASCSAFPNQDGATGAYAPWCSHLLFFMLVWIAKRDNDITDLDAPLRDRDGAPLLHATAEAAVQQIAGCLQMWGEVVAALKGERIEETRFQQEWELLRIQLVRGVAHYQCPNQAKDAAVSDCLLNLLGALKRIPSPDALGSVQAACAMAVQLGEGLTRLYDFSSPLYAYAKRAAHNALMDILTHTPHNDADESQLSLTAVIDGPSAEWNGAEYEAALFSFRLEFQRLLNAIDRELPPRQHQVVRLTLALRPQFKRALVLLNGASPDVRVDDSPVGQVDRVVAAAITKQTPDKPASENDVRVLRFHAKKTISRFDAVLGMLLARFLEP